MITIGIDPGLSGAIAFLSDGKFLTVQDMPITAKGSGSVKNEVDPAGVVSILRRYAPVDEAIMVVIERVNAMPGQGSSSIFSLGDSFGCVRAAVAACRFEMVYLTPTSWKKHFSLTSDKEMCRAAAIRMFPEAPLNLKKYVDRAEALLMARWLYDKKGGG
jgi:crossover junction endodeoxyribonuclease RuvC